MTSVIVDVILCILLLSVPVILLLIPATRRKNGSWLIALKTVPPGLVVFCLCGMFLPMALRHFSIWKEENSPILFWIILPVTLCAAFLVIISAGLLIRKRFGAEKKYNPWPSVLLFFLFLPPVIIGRIILHFAVEVAFYSQDPANYRGEWRSVALPPEGDTKLSFEFQNIHPFLAEYNYRLCFSHGDDVSRRRLFINCGGRTHFNLYRLKDGRFLFRDKDWDYLVDVSRRKVCMLRSFREKLYAFPVPDEEITSWSGPRQEKGKVIVSMDVKDIPGEDVTGILDDKVYFGCILDTFHSAADMPEAEIRNYRTDSR